VLGVSAPLKGVSCVIPVSLVYMKAHHTSLGSSMNISVSG
jgi:hypothetical protein